MNSIYKKLSSSSIYLIVCAALALAPVMTHAQATPDAEPNTNSPAPVVRRIAITIDDLPFETRYLKLADVQRATKTMLATLQAHKVKALGFVNEDRLLVKGEVDARIGLLESWLDAGMELGNHNFGHLGFHGSSLAKYQEAVLRGDTFTRWLLQERKQVPRYYRFPHNQTGDNAEVQMQFEQFLHQHGYKVAPFTIEHDDFIYARVYEDTLLKNRKDEAERLRKDYLANLDRAVNTFETMSDEMFGRQISHILNIHVSLLNADMLDKMLGKLEQRGYQFITLEEALQDPAYQLPAGPSGQYGMSWLARWARMARKRLSVYGQPDPEEWIMKRDQELQR
ncbi:MAG: polysaccharide deacetylase family protein [Pseudomonadota bacterium]